MILNKIIARKKITLEESRYMFDVLSLAKIIKTDRIAGFYEAMKKNGLSIIGEVKKASPSKGVIKEDFNPVEMAKQYEQCVDAISVLTEEHFFQGSPKYLSDIHKAVKLPLLRKDFIISPFQISQARELGASAVLLIAAVLKEKRVLAEFIAFAKGMGLECLVEAHNEKEIELSLEAGARIIGVNNRNLKDFSEDINTTLRLSSLVPKDKVLISESAIRSAEDIKIVKQAGVSGILVGESFMRSGDIIAKAKEFREAYEG